MESFAALFIGLRDFFNHHIVFTLGMLLISGYLFGLIAQKVRLPSITGYIVAGLVLSQSVTGIVRPEMKESLASITEIALGLIALTIGGEFNISKIRRIGWQVVIITWMQAVLAFLLVTGAFIIAGLDVPYAILLGAIAVATDPATTVIVVRELRARGKFIDYLYGVVALDDAVAVFIFSISFAFAASMLGGGNTDTSVWHMVLHVGREIGGSILLGMFAGYILHLLTNRNIRKSEILIISIGLIFLSTSIAIVLHLSLIITNMMMGTMLVNLSGKNRRIFTIIEPLTPPVFALFFIIAGTELHLSVFVQLLVIGWGALFLITRFLGKTIGVYISSLMTRAPQNIRKYLGLCLFPQAGVSIGLVLYVQASPVISGSDLYIGDLHILIVLVNIILLNVLINELVGPIVTKYGVKKGADLE